MKHLLTGVSIAAALAIAAPVWAQNAPMSPSAPAASAPAAPAAAGKQRHHRAVHHRMARHGRAAKANPNAMANELNREELTRLQGGGAAPPPPAPPPAMTGPRPSSTH
jgi:hypothetical protein